MLKKCTTCEELYDPLYHVCPKCKSELFIWFEPDKGKYEMDDVEGVLQLFKNDVLAAIVRGGVDLNDLAAQELAARGLDRLGKWVGFKSARAIYVRFRRKPKRGKNV